MDFKKLGIFMDSIHKLVGVPGADLSVYYKHEEVFRKGVGFSDCEGKRPVSDEDLYHVYSMSKVALAVSAMQLVEKELISLEDPVSKYLPEAKDIKVKENDKLVSCKREATIEDLLSMQAGFDYGNIIPKGRPDISEFVGSNPHATTREIIKAWIQGAPFLFQPGERYLYSMCHDVMAAVIEEVTGEKYSDYVTNHIGKPLGMKDIYFHLPKEERDKRMVQSYLYSQDAQLDVTTLQYKPIPSAFDSGSDYIFSDNYDSAGAGIITRLSDYVLLADALANDGIGKSGNQILTRESIDNMRRDRLDTPQKVIDYRIMLTPGYGYGLGVRTLTDNSISKSPLGEFGWDGKGGAFFLSDVTNNIAICYFMSVEDMPFVKAQIHQRIRDLAYEAIIG